MEQFKSKKKKKIQTEERRKIEEVDEAPAGRRVR
jgi:hypothetical protein